MPDLEGGSPSTIRLSMKITIALDLSAGEGRRLARRKAADAIATDYDYLDNNDYDKDHPDNVGVGLSILATRSPQRTLETVGPRWSPVSPDFESHANCGWNDACLYCSYSGQRLGANNNSYDTINEK